MPELKIVLNTKYGGFSLSKQAVDLYNEYKGTQLSEEDACYLSRDDEVLVRVVEELDNFANGPCARLKVVTVDISFRIEDYDGIEAVVINTYEE